MTGQHRIVDCHGIEVCFEPELDGGGSFFGGDYVAFLRSKGVRRVGRVFEWCAGPGFIGFHLLGSGLCDSLCLADVNPAAVRLARETVRRNGLEDRVAVYEADCLEGIPESERWDLVVGNPPHYGGRGAQQLAMSELLYRDTDWELHRRFFAGVDRFLAPRAMVILQENYCFTRQTTFASLVADAGFRLRSSSPVPAHSNIYYLWVEQPPAGGSPLNVGRWEFPYERGGAVEELHYLQEWGFLVEGTPSKPRARTLREIIEYRWPLISAVYRQRPGWLMIAPETTVVVRAQDLQEAWTFEFLREGVLRITAGECASQATLTASGSVFLDLFERRLLPLVAHADGGPLRIDGNEWTALQLAFLLCNPFFTVAMQDWGRYWDQRSEPVRGNGAVAASTDVGRDLTR